MCLDLPCPTQQRGQDPQLHEDSVAPDFPAAGWGWAAGRWLPRSSGPGVQVPPASWMLAGLPSLRGVGTMRGAPRWGGPDTPLLLCVAASDGPRTKGVLPPSFAASSRASWGLGPHWGSANRRPGCGSRPVGRRAESSASSPRPERPRPAARAPRPLLMSSSGLCLKVTEGRVTAREQTIPMWS